jgi:receptor protein-tyrosine kinase
MEEPGTGELLILPAGPPPPNPAALIGSQEMQRVLSELESQSDLVIVDTPAALAVSDSIALMRSVSGVVLVARMGTSTRQTVRRLQVIIESAHGTLLGVVATGAAASPAYGSYSGEYGREAANGIAPSKRRNKNRPPNAAPSSTADEPEAASPQS